MISLITFQGFCFRLAYSVLQSITLLVDFTGLSYNIICFLSHLLVSIGIVNHQVCHFEFYFLMDRYFEHFLVNI